MQIMFKKLMFAQMGVYNTLPALSNFIQQKMRRLIKSNQLNVFIWVD